MRCSAPVLRFHVDLLQQQVGWLQNMFHQAAVVGWLQ